ncbi:four-carbon acid sugar kinase family protein [Terribacillus saccharophilus]|uniref:four-carbon acid sugar kinase family protein n=1 Tax=Terribacillus saccharophilus TaxID=361277 RepID=UPI002DC62C54|nr:four-carbon acid sugar kinase family protein [Terribacillus saccharophilus]MEC0288972.1 four-carbon acid sugar kinase family protein [Terribacillus saccharophilus]
MKLAIIADDLTGANDSGVQLARAGLETKVFLEQDYSAAEGAEAIVFDTDSRSIAPNEAYNKIKSITEFLLRAGFHSIYKKIDSTMRGNIGNEIKAFGDTIGTDFVIIAPGYPKNGRTVIDGNHYLNGVLLNQTEIAHDPKTPVHEAHIPTLLKGQIDEEIGLIPLEVIRSNEKIVQLLLHEFKKQNIKYVVADSDAEEDLQRLLELTNNSSYSIAWVGSAGLASYLPSYYGIQHKANKELLIPSHDKPVLTVVGSVNKQSRNQLNLLLKETSTVGICLDSAKAVSSIEEREKEIKRIVEAAKVTAAKGLDTAIYTAGSKEDISHARETGRKQGLNETQVSNEIVKMLGEVIAKLIREELFNGLVMTGGDTAKQVCSLLDTNGFHLYDELEIGVPISAFIGKETLFVITKSGGFGKETVFIDAIKKLRGVVHI